MENNNTAPAFPIKFDSLPVNSTLTRNDCQGLTKREYFAAMAMQGILANPHSSSLKSQYVSSLAINNADELLNQLNQK